MSELEVRIENIEPMLVASVRVFGKTPEVYAWKKLIAWAEPLGLLEDTAKHPVFGFNNPDPAPGIDEYGYECWIRVESDMEPEGEIEFKDFSGGTYAVTTCEVKGDPWKIIPQTWKQLIEYGKSRNYRFGSHQWLEKVLDPRASTENLVLDLYLPIEQ